MNPGGTVIDRSHGLRTVAGVKRPEEDQVRKLVAVVGVVGVVASCGADATARAGGHPQSVRFASRVNNPWYPLAPRTTLTYRGVKDGKPSRDVFTVTRAKRTVDGVRCTVVKDILYLSGKVEERTTDWYAQDTSGNVWYFGERTAELDTHGRVKSRAGSWEAGVKGARAGIFMPAHPRVGQSGRQEYYRGQAEDHYRVKSLAAKVHTPAASSTHALLTEEWTPLEPGVLDHKYYVRGIGTVLEQTVKGGDERNTLVSIRHG
jgi:hypothetical protein